jgi:ABC-type ATPase involved in cell division
MSGEERAREDARHVVAVANAMLAAGNYDRVGTARGLAIIATVLVGDDPSGRLALAAEMLELVRELEPNLVTARWH